MKFLKPLYRGLLATAEGREVARRAFAAHAGGYHPIARRGIERIMAG